MKRKPASPRDRALLFSPLCDISHIPPSDTFQHTFVSVKGEPLASEALADWPVL